METIKFHVRKLLVVGAVCAALPATAQDVLKVGSAKVDVNPPAKEPAKNMLGVLDPINVRAIVIDDGKTCAAMVTVDAGAIGTETWQKVSARAERELQIPAAQLLLTATHAHSAPLAGEKAVPNWFECAVVCQN